MHHIAKHGFILVALFAIGAYAAFAARGISLEEMRRLVAGAFFIETISEQELRNIYSAAVERGADAVSVLVVPGHDQVASGTWFRNLREIDLTLEMGKYLTEFLGADAAFEVTLTQDETGWLAPFAEYFIDEREEIIEFRTTQRAGMKTAVNAGAVDKVRGIRHNRAPTETSIKLYGINKWANENDIDIVLHVHFNDDPTRTKARVGTYTGFALYVPESQYSNARASKALAEALHAQLSSKFSASDLPLERAGVIESQNLIAVGSNNSLASAVTLLELGYIYEPQFANADVRASALKEIARQTYLGIKRFFEVEDEDGHTAPTALLPYEWTENLGHGMRSRVDILALQAALMEEGVYPPKGSTAQDCPLNSNFRGCTKRAVEAFQIKHGIKPASGFVGPLTRTRLNSLYGEE